MAVVGVLFAISCVVGVVHGGCQAGNGKELLIFDQEYNETLKPPIQKVVRDVKTQRVECLEAYITNENLLHGTSTNTKIQIYSKKMGCPNDQAGHIVANILGGTGYRTYNIIPQSRISNTGSNWRTHVETATRNKVRDENVNATFIVEPQYDSNIHLTRPYKIKYSVTFTDGTPPNNGIVDNPFPNKNWTSCET